MEGQYKIIVSGMDAYAAFRAEADRAASEHMDNTAERQSATALHIQNAGKTMQRLCPDGHRVVCYIGFEVVPDVNPVLKPEYQG